MTKPNSPQHHCNYCFKPMEEYIVENQPDNIIFLVCTTPKCPAYALMQIAQEQMPKVKEEKV